MFKDIQMLKFRGGSVVHMPLAPELSQDIRQGGKFYQDAQNASHLVFSPFLG